MRFSIRKLIGSSLLVLALAISSFGGRPFIEAHQPEALQSGDLAELLAATASAASVDYFLKIDGIEGESTDRAHKGEIEIESFSWGVSQGGNRAAGGGGGTGKANFQDFHFTMQVSKASPKLFLATATGQHIKEAVLTARKSGENQQEYLKVTFTDLLISSYQTGGSSGDVVPTDEVSLNYSKIEIEYTPQKEDGSADTPVKAGYDLKANKKV